MGKIMSLFASVHSVYRNASSIGAGLLLIGLLAHSAHASQDRFGGVFLGGNDPHNLLVGLTWQQLGDKMAELGEQRQKLIDVEIIERQTPSAGQHNPPAFAGVWREGNYGQSLIGGLVWDDFVQEVRNQHRLGMRIIDMETHVEYGVRKYVAVFRTAYEPRTANRLAAQVESGYQRLATGMSWSEFTAEYASQHGAGWHLIDIETYQDHGTRYWAAVWNEGYKDEWLYAWPRERFEILQEFLNGSQQLVDMESWREGDTRMVAGLFYGLSDPVTMETGENWQKFIPLWEDHAKNGRRLIDLEVYPDTTDRRWKNTFAEVLGGKAMGWSFAVMESGILAETGAEGWARSPHEWVNASMPMEPDSVMNVASVTKLMTTVGILERHEQLGEDFSFIDWPIGYYLQGYYAGIHPSLWNVTIRDVLTQKTGMQEPNGETSPTWDELGNNYTERIGKWLTLPLVGTPGAGKASYYNHYFNLLILILEASTGQDYEAWMNADVYGPLGIGPLSGSPKTLITDPLYYRVLPDGGFGASFSKPGDSCFEGEGNGGCWYASAIDMARLVASFRDGTILEPATVQMMGDEVMAWYPWPPPNGPYREKNGGLCDGKARGLGADVMALTDDFDVCIITNSWTSYTCDPNQQAPICLEDLIVQAYDAPEDW